MEGYDHEIMGGWRGEGGNVDSHLEPTSMNENEERMWIRPENPVSRFILGEAGVSKVQTNKIDK